MVYTWWSKEFLHLLNQGHVKCMKDTYFSIVVTILCGSLGFVVHQKINLPIGTQTLHRRHSRSLG